MSSMSSYQIVDDIIVEADTPEDEILLAARYADVTEEELLAAIQEAGPSSGLVNCTDDQGRTPMHMAAANGHEGFATMLVSCGATPDLANKEGCTALHYAAVNNHCGVAAILLKAGWKPSIRDLTGRLPINLVYDKGHDDMEVLLLEADDTLDDPANLPEGATLTTTGEASDGPTGYGINDEGVDSNITGGDGDNPPQSHISTSSSINAAAASSAQDSASSMRKGMQENEEGIENDMQHTEEQNRWKGASGEAERTRKIGGADLDDVE